MRERRSRENAPDDARSDDERNDISQFLFDLTILSTSLFVFSALFIKFLLNLVTAGLLKISSIRFQYSLFDIGFMTTDSTKWPVKNITLIFGLGYLLLTILGIILYVFTRKSSKITWKKRLTGTWLSFLMVNTLFAGIISGVFFYNGFGIVFQWLSGNIVSRSITGAVISVLMIISRQAWIPLFLKASPRRTFLKDEKYKEFFLNNVFVKSWLFGSVILLLFNKPLTDGFWPLFFFSLGLVALPLYKRPLPSKTIVVKKSEKKIFRSRFSLLLIILVLASIRLLGLLRFDL